MSIQKETGYFKAFRDEQAHAFSFLNQGRPLYLSGSFISVNQKINVGGELRTVMKPTEGTYYMIHALYGQVNQFIRNEDTEQLFNDLYGVPQEIYTALPSSAIRSVKMQVGSEENFAIQSIGAEFLDAKGIYEPLHTLFMYRIVDGNYNVYYALSTSMAMLEYKSNELHNAPEIEYFNDSMFSEEGFLVNGYNLKQFMFALMEDYFKVDATEVKITGSTSILSLHPETPDFEIIGVAGEEALHDTGRNERIGLIISTDEKFSLS